MAGRAEPVMNETHPNAPGRMTQLHDTPDWLGQPDERRPMHRETSARAWTYRRDRWAEPWHIVPAGELGARGRALCGSPRQGTPLSEDYAPLEPMPPER